ncbi:HET-domain-containing protein [Stipitochalara longipes BDJ]|nr:HET-domain-containing protein [Stipitochalara longipes BDJ]
MHNTSLFPLTYFICPEIDAMFTNGISSLIYSTAHLDLKSKDIRLVEVLPDNEATVISCRFHAQTLQKPSPYTALSYAWGDSRNMKEILLDGEAFRVRDNLWQFLHQMRVQGRRDRFWIDAICIDQENVKERNHQVALMKDIYTKAIQVVVWLGPTSANSQLAINKLKAISTTTTRANNIYPIWTAEAWEAVWDLCQRDYWTRIWIVQEFVLAEELTLHCGSDSLPWHNLSFLFIIQQDYDVPNQIDRNSKANIIWVSRAALTVHQRIRKETEITASPLTELVQAHQLMESTDVRDKIYGLLGLATDVGLPEIHIMADYEKSAAEIYWDFIDQCRMHHNRLCDLCGRFARVLHHTLKLPDYMAPKMKGRHLVNWTEHNGVFLWPKRNRGGIPPVNAAEGDPMA